VGSGSSSFVPIGSPALGNSNGTLLLGSTVCSATGCGLAFSRSLNGGSSWAPMTVSEPIGADTLPHDAQIITGSGAFANLSFAIVVISHPTSGQVDVHVDRSEDAGQTWIRTGDPIQPPGFQGRPVGEFIESDARLAITFPTLVNGRVGFSLVQSLDLGTTWNTVFTSTAAGRPSGHNAQCGDPTNPTRASVVGDSVAVQDSVVLVFSPADTGFIAFTRHGADATDDSDILWRRSTDGGVTWSAPAQLGHPDAINIFPSLAVRSDETVGMSYLTNAYSRRGDTFVVAMDLFRNGRRERAREIVSKPFRLSDLSPNPDTALLDCDGFSGPSIAPTPSGFEIVFPATGFSPKAPHDVDVYSSTVDLPVL
jgi:hypothetical protein